MLTFFVTFTCSPPLFCTEIKSFLRTFPWIICVPKKHKNRKKSTFSALTEEHFHCSNCHKDPRIAVTLARSDLLSRILGRQISSASPTMLPDFVKIRSLLKKLLKILIVDTYMKHHVLFLQKLAKVLIVSSQSIVICVAFANFLYTIRGKKWCGWAISTAKSLL